jgi:hypothetical protein
MRAIPMRYLLPWCNLAIDLTLSGLLARSIEVARFHEKRSSGVRTEAPIRPVALLQEGQAGVRWHPRYIWAPPPPQVYAIISGTLPAGVISAWGVPSGAWGTAFSPGWARVHEGMALLVWFGLGWLAESPPLRKWALRYVGLRALSVPASLGRSAAGLFTLAMTLAWVAAAAWLAGWGLKYGYRFVLLPHEIGE